MKVNSIIRTLAAATFALAALSAGAQGANAPREANKRADSEYKVAKARCGAMKGNAQDVCEKEAKATRDKSKADVRATTKGTPEARADAGETKAKADYKVQMERCEALKGKDQVACESKAKASLDSRQAVADKQRKSN